MMTGLINAGIWVGMYCMESWQAAGWQTRWLDMGCVLGVFRQMMDGWLFRPAASWVSSALKTHS